MAKAPPPTDPIVLKVIDLIGVDALNLLARHGFTVVEERLAAKFAEEYKASNNRVRETAAAAMRAIGIDAARVEPTYDREGNVSNLIFTTPTRDEMAFAKAVGDFLRDALPMSARPDGAVVDTNDVAFHTTPPSPDNVTDPVD